MTTFEPIAKATRSRLLNSDKHDANLVEGIKRIKKEKNAVLLAHYYQTPDIQNIADYLGDSLGLSQQAAKTSADIILFAGVHFMAETAKILSPQKKVLIPTLEAGCSLADSCLPEKFREFINEHPGDVVVSYVNCSAEIKAMSDIICTSSNAEMVVKSIPENKKIIFAPDKNLGNYLINKTGREMVLWDGSCIVHESFSREKILALKAGNPGAKVIAHPECEKTVLELADFIGSTSALLKYTQLNSANEFIVATELGILYQMQLASPQKKFIAGPSYTVCEACNECPYMKKNTLENIYLALKNETPEIILSNEIMDKARLPIDRMLELSSRYGL